MVPRPWFDTLLFNLLTPISWLFRGLTALRRLAFRHGWLGSARLPVPVVVVGNIIVGGAGKTPLTLYLARQLRAAGLRPGIVSRGYGSVQEGVAAVSPEATPAQVGDEPLLLARESGCPVWIGRDRAAAGPGPAGGIPRLQPDPLRRRPAALPPGPGRGNRRVRRARPGQRPPAAGGPPAGAAAASGPRWMRWWATAWPPILLFSAKAATPPLFRMDLRPASFHGLQDPSRQCSAADLAGKRLYAVAGIGHPLRFFRTLAELGLTVEARAFPDHHAYTRRRTWPSPGTVVLLTTAKDGVKCAAIYGGEAWVLPVDAQLTPDLSAFVLEKINGRTVCWTSWSARCARVVWSTARSRRNWSASPASWPSQVRDDIPIMLEEEARTLGQDEN